MSFNAPTAGRAPGPRESVLVVDDEPFMCKAAVAMLTVLGHDAYAVCSAEDAVECVTREPGRFTCALIDYSMTPMDGRACSQALRTASPSLRVLIMTGYNIEDEAAALRAEGISAVLQKPLTLGLLRAHIGPVTT